MRVCVLTGSSAVSVSDPTVDQIAQIVMSGLQRICASERFGSGQITGPKTSGWDRVPAHIYFGQVGSWVISSSKPADEVWTRDLPRDISFHVNFLAWQRAAYLHYWTTLIVPPFASCTCTGYATESDTLSPIHTADAVETKLSSLVASAVYTHRRRDETALSRRRRRCEHNSRLLPTDSVDNFETDQTDSIAFDYTDFDKYW